MNNTAKTTNNVVNLNQNTVYSDILSHLRSAAISDNSRIAYRSDLKQFFMHTRNKEIEELTVSDLKYRNAEIENYQTYLSKELLPKLKNTTVNRKLQSILSLFKKLRKNDYDINIEAMKVKDLPDDSHQSGFLTFEETEVMAELVKKQQNGMMKSALIKLAVRTSLRKEELLDLTWDKIRVSDHDENIYWIETMGKGNKKAKKNISKEMFQILLSIDNSKYTDNKVFHIANGTIALMVQTLCEQMNIDPRRNVSFHSYKKAGAGYVYELTGDLGAASDQCGHSSMDTTKRYYVETQENIAGMAMDEKFDKDLFAQLTRDEMLELLLSVENGLGLALKRKAKKIVDGRK